MNKEADKKKLCFVIIKQARLISYSYAWSINNTAVPWHSTHQLQPSGYADRMVEVLAW